MTLAASLPPVSGVASRSEVDGAARRRRVLHTSSLPGNAKSCEETQRFFCSRRQQESSPPFRCITSKFVDNALIVERDAALPAKYRVSSLSLSGQSSASQERFSELNPYSCETVGHRTLSVGRAQILYKLRLQQEREMEILRLSVAFR
ncbi:hypothetical protein BV25DRAFT_77107 [Artomyces pyxidatus]|uniref:Uncharacterized protein n=1 Tax=Artomyces pyxidatus TaxID=48021 RepID=A0ACB8TKQ0_9AGAM|nr:hypothetical protein BV25DRAFT_77107 [Artomyces pyxidatus]